ncbi:MAG: metallophosphoesterase, partial [Candidatus Latescibacterota bacterium]
GDIVGYGASPNECVDMIRSRSAHVLLGNHDAAAVGLTMIESFNAHARTAARWTQGQRTEENTEYLKSLPMEYQGDGYCAVHASPNESEEWHYVVNQTIAEEAFRAFDGSLCFIGHSHVPVYFRQGAARGVRIGEEKIRFPEEGRFIVNVGSVGQPRDNDPRFSLGIYDTRERTLELRRGTYDVAAASAKILKAGLPEMLAARLHLGI